MHSGRKKEDDVIRDTSVDQSAVPPHSLDAADWLQVKAILRSSRGSTRLVDLFTVAGTAPVRRRESRLNI